MHPSPAFVTPAPPTFISTSTSTSTFVSTFVSNLPSRHRPTPAAPLRTRAATVTVISANAQALSTDTADLSIMTHQLHDSSALSAITAMPSNMHKYSALMQLLQKDQAAFFRIAQANLSTILPIIYTPVVGEACLEYPQLDIPRRGTWLTPAQHKGKVAQTLRALNLDVDVIVVSDCQRILGLGDLGANGMPIPVGKLLLYSACGGIEPSKTLPVVLDMGCDVAAIRDDPNYSGIREPRITGQAYEEFVQEFIDAVKEVFGTDCLVQFEDFGNFNAARLLRKFRSNVLSFNDDIQGTAAVGLAGILAALRVHNVLPRLTDHKFLFLGAGSAGIGIADLIVLALTQQGLTLAEARAKCWFIDSKGLIFRGRSAKLTQEKEAYAHQLPADLAGVLQKGEGGALPLHDYVRLIQPTALIGVSTMHGAFNEQVFQEMCACNQRPIVFALSNPTSKSECTAEQAYGFSKGQAVFASGSPFGKVGAFTPGQGNNCFIFPGLGLGVVLSKARKVTDGMVLAASQRLAKLVDEDSLNATGCVYPDIDDLLHISAHIAKAVWEQAVKEGVAVNAGDAVSVDDIRRSMYEPSRVRLSGY